MCSLKVAGKISHADARNRLICPSERIKKVSLFVDAEINKYDPRLIYFSWQPRVTETPTACTARLPTPQVSPTSAARCCLHRSCGSCQSGALWHANCHGDMCVTASESLFIGVRHAVRPAWFCLRQSTLWKKKKKKKRAAGIKNRHNTHSVSLSLSLSAVSYISAVCNVVIDS